jgi:formylglycine-generating enzyme required for sulfatase activity
MSHGVFISYSTRDKATADAVCAYLEARKIRCWIAPRDVPAGQIFADALIDAIDASGVFVLVLSDGSNSSRHVFSELAEAIDKGIPIIPLRVQDVKPSKAMGYYINQVHWLDALTPPLEQHLGALAERLEALLKLPREAQPAEVAPQGAKDVGRTAATVQVPAAASVAADEQKRHEAEQQALQGARQAAALAAEEAEQERAEHHLQEVRDKAEAALTAGLLEDARHGAEAWMNLEPDVARPLEILARVTYLEDLGKLRRTASGVVIATPENLAELLGMPEPPARVWWEKAEMELCLVPAGEFPMGSGRSDRSARDNEKPQHRVHVDAFYIGRYPATQAQYARFVQAKDHRVPFYEADWTRPYNWDPEAKGPPRDRSDHPVVLVSWDDAVAFCRWAGLRLPTEAEWEKAARGTDERIYPWGNTWDPGRCNSHEGKKGGTTPVGAFSPEGDSPYGCADIAGNAWEWCADRYDEAFYASSPERNPLGPAAGETRVQRGGSWNYVSSYQRAANRGWNYPDTRENCLGFRCGLSSTPA